VVELDLHGELRGESKGYFVERRTLSTLVSAKLDGDLRNPRCPDLAFIVHHLAHSLHAVETKWVRRTRKFANVKFGRLSFQEKAHFHRFLFCGEPDNSLDLV
jgi:hypothetical protein